MPALDVSDYGARQLSVKCMIVLKRQRKNRPPNARGQRRRYLLSLMVAADPESWNASDGSAFGAVVGEPKSCRALPQAQTCRSSRPHSRQCFPHQPVCVFSSGRWLYPHTRSVGAGHVDSIHNRFVQSRMLPPTPTSNANKKTYGEELFEHYLRKHHVSFEREPSLGDRTSKRVDYVIPHEHGPVYLEVKDIDHRVATASGSFDPYGPIRREIKDGMKKFRALKVERNALVLIAAPTSFVMLEAPHIVLGAMYGIKAFVFRSNPRRGVSTTRSLCVSSSSGEDSWSDQVEEPHPG